MHVIQNSGCRMNWDLLPQHEDQYNMALLTHLHRKETEEMVSITLLLNNCTQLRNNINRDMVQLNKSNHALIESHRQCDL